MRLLSYFALLLLLCTCGRAPQRTIDLSDQVTENPEDGIGHYVYALTLPETVAPGSTLPLAMEWRTVGPVDPTARYALDILLDGPRRKSYRYAPSNNTVGEYHLANWQTYRLKLPEDFPAGTYTVAVAIYDAEGQPVTLGFKQDLVYEAGYYRLAEVEVAME